MKPITNEETKKEVQQEIQTWKEQQLYIQQDINKLEKQNNQLDRWIFEANIKISAYERRKRNESPYEKNNN